jgi:hypothetical protein
MIIEVVTAFVASHVGGMAVGGLLGRHEMFGFGLKAIQFASQRRAKRRHERAKDDLESWLSENADPE